jgi:D-xylose transport system substrate-binding protein
MPQPSFRTVLTASKIHDIHFLDCRENNSAQCSGTIYDSVLRLAEDGAGGSHAWPALTREDEMKTVLKLMAGVAVIVSLHSVAQAKDLVVGVSWSNFQEERWKTDEAAIKAALEASGDKYISADAQSSAAKQLTDIESLIAQGANALIVLAQDSDAIGPAIEKAAAEGIPVVGYDRLIENPAAFYITFDNKEVGRMQAREVFKVKPEGNYVFIKGSSSDPNADFLFSGQMEVLKEAVDAGKIKNVGEAYTDGWKPENAQKNMEQFLTANDNKVDAVVASNDGTAGGAVAALDAQDADKAALNRVALGTQTVSVWKDSRELGKRAAEVAVELAGGKKMEEVSGVTTFNGGPKGVAMQSVFLAPLPITKDNLNVVIDAGWISKAEACQGVKGDVAACK